MKKFSTTNRKLEQFLYFHRINFRTQRKTNDLLTEWVYDNTPRLQEVVAEFLIIWGAK